MAPSQNSKTGPDKHRPGRDSPPTRPNRRYCTEPIEIGAHLGSFILLVQCVMVSPRLNGTQPVLSARSVDAPRKDVRGLPILYIFLRQRLPMLMNVRLRQSIFLLAVPLLVMLSLETAQAKCMLFDAAKKGDLEMVQAVLATGKQLNCENRRGATPLWIAASKGHVQVIKALVAAGADMEAQEDRLGSPLFAALTHNRPRAFATLVELGADLNATDPRQWSVLMRAISLGRLAQVKMLLDHGVDAERYGPDGVTAFKVATTTHQHNMIFALRKAKVKEHE